MDTCLWDTNYSCRIKLRTNLRGWIIDFLFVFAPTSFSFKTYVTNLFSNIGTWAPVFPDEGGEGSNCKFPDGSPFPRDSEKRRSKFVYVWQVWG